MAIIGKALRQKWQNEAYEASHPELASERVRFRRVAEQALADTMAKFSPLTADNFAEANEYREMRIKELLTQSAD